MIRKELLENKDKIIELYVNNKLSANEIAEKICGNKHFYMQITKLLKENNIRIRNFNETRPRNKLKLNIDYFKNIDTIDKAYWLGFLYADGTVIYNRGLPSKIVFALKDPDPVFSLQKAIESNHKVAKYEILDKRTNKIYTRFNLQITSNLFTKNVISTGLIGKNNYQTQFPNIKEEFYSHFIRGLFDGDGCISEDKKGRYRIGFIATKPIADFIQNYFIMKFNINETKLSILNTNPTGELCVLHIYSYSDISEILKYLYSDSNENTRLNRKHLKYLKFKKDSIGNTSLSTQQPTVM